MHPDDEFFNYTPTSAGVVFDVGGHAALSFAKGAVVQFISMLESDTEDKVYVYTKPVVGLPKKLGPSVAHASNYKDMPIVLDVALKCVIDALYKTDPDSNRVAFYFTDRTNESRNRRLCRAVNLAASYEMGILFVVVNLGEADVELEAACEEIGAAYLKIEPKKLTGVLLREVANG